MMKALACLLAVLALGPALFANDDVDEFSLPETIAVGNGNILFANVGNFSVTPCKWIRLSTNSAYTVVCQIAYENPAFDNGPSAPAEIMQTRQAESCLNLALLKFLQKTYGGMSDAELVRRYRAGSVRAKVEDDFPTWFDDYVKATLKSLHKATPVDDVLVLKVSMRAVGPFAEALEEL